MATIEVQSPIYTLCTRCNMRKDGKQRARTVPLEDCEVLDAYTTIEYAPYARESYPCVMLELRCSKGHRFSVEADLEIQQTQNEE